MYKKRKRKLFIGSSIIGARSQKRYWKFAQWTLTWLLVALIFYILLHLKDSQVQLTLSTVIHSESVVKETTTSATDLRDLTQDEDGDYFDEEMQKRLLMSKAQKIALDQDGDKNNPGYKVKPKRPKVESWCTGSIGFRAKNHSNPLVALSSIPGSGNTWVRYLLQQATGIYTGSVYHDPGLKKAGFGGEKVVDSTVLSIKTHSAGEEKFDQAIVIVRHPKEAILAEFNWEYSRKSLKQPNPHIGLVAQEEFYTKKWANHVAQWAKTWEDFHLKWLNSDKFSKPGAMLIVFYDDLKSNTERELRRMLDFLKIKVDEDVIKCALSDQVRQGVFKRNKSGTKQEQEDPFTKKMTANLQRKWLKMKKRFDKVF